MEEREVRSAYPSRNFEMQSIGTFCAKAINPNPNNERQQSIIKEIRLPKWETVVQAKNKVKYSPIVAELATHDFSSLVMVNGQ